MDREKRVLIVGGGVAALATAAALVEHNQTKAGTGVRFDITVMTSDDIWGGRASSWPGGTHDRPATAKTFWDFRQWPPDVPLNHGFHAVFDESTYVNFWYTLHLAGLSPDALKGHVLISNDHEILVHESEARTVCSLRVHRANKYPYPFNSHLTQAAWEVLRRGGWSPLEIYSFGVKVMLRGVFRYRDFETLASLDEHQQISFGKWCRDRGVRATVMDKMMFKFLFQGTYIAPNTMDAASAIMGLWVILRHRDAARWYYINGGITEHLMQPIAGFLGANGVKLQLRRQLTALVPLADFSAISGYVTRDLESQREAPDALGAFDYYVSTLPLDCAVDLLKRSGAAGVEPKGDEYSLLDGFPDIRQLALDKRFVQPAGTVNLQAWFQESGLLGDAAKPNGDYRNVIAGLEPLCVLVDYKNVLPKYRDDARFPGSVLEVNGSLQELESPEHYGYFDSGTRFGDPDETRTIDFAKAILIDMARRYSFPKLKKAVEAEAFLAWPDDWPDRRFWPGKGRRIPPFLWKNIEPFNKFFITGPGTLQYRPWVWRRRYPSNVLNLRRTGYPGPDGYPSNLFLAGDWTRNGFDIPCMEGAARSGRMAALSIVKAAFGRDDPTADPTQTAGSADAAYIEVYDPR